MQIDADMIPLKQALYGPDGVFPDLRRCDVFRLIKPMARTSRQTGLTHYFVSRDDLCALRQFAALAAAA